MVVVIDLVRRKVIMKTILLPLNGTAPNETLIRAAVKLSSQNGAYIQAAWCQQNLPIIAGEGITLPAEYLSQFEHDEQQLEKSSRQAFDNLMREFNISKRDLHEWDGNSMGAGWVSLKGSGAIALAEFARTFDLVLQHRPVPEGTVEWRTTCETVLFESGRPLILISNNLPDKIGDNIVIAWNGSSETARTMAMGQYYLQNAKQVHVIEVEGGMVSGPNAESVAVSLRAHGVNASSVSRQCESGSVSEVIMSYARDVNADLIVKGAYTHSRLRALIFGGVTSDIFSHSEIPVLFCH